MTAEGQGPGFAIAWCAPAKGTTHALRCQSCGFESDDLEDFNMSTCWECCHRSSWSEACQEERHEECAHGDPDDPEFCPCPHHDEDFTTPALASPSAGAGLDGAEAVPRGLAPALPSGCPGQGRAARPSPVSPVAGGGCAPQFPAGGTEGVPSAGLDPVPAATGAGRGLVEPPRLAPVSPATPGAGGSAPGATAGESLTPHGDSPARQSSPPPQAPATQGPGGGAQDPPGGSAASPPGGTDPAGAAAEEPPAALAGQQDVETLAERQARRQKEIADATAAHKAQQRRERARPYGAKRRPRQQPGKPGMGRIYPGGGGGGAA